jgi:hypothetical protein
VFLVTALKKTGKEIQHLLPWIEEGLKLGGVAVTILEPALVPVLTSLETALGAIPTSGELTAAQLQQFTTAIAQAYALGMAAAKGTT